MIPTMSGLFDRGRECPLSGVKRLHPCLRWRFPLITALRRANPTLAVVLLAVATMLGLTILWPFASDLFRFGPLHLDDLALTLGVGALLLLSLELLKPLWRATAQS